MKDAYKNRNDIVVDEVDAKKIAKEVVRKKMKSIVDEVIKDVAPKKKRKSIILKL